MKSCLRDLAHIRIFAGLEEVDLATDETQIFDGCCGDAATQLEAR